MVHGIPRGTVTSVRTTCIVHYGTYVVLAPCHFGPGSFLSCDVLAFCLR